MPKYERGTYEPSSDDRRVFDGGEGIDEDEDEGSRVPLLIVIAFLVVAAFLGVVWLAYSQGVAKGREGATPVIQADNGPVRTAPENQGSQTPYTGLKIYEQPAPPDDEIDDSGASAAPPVTRPAAKPAKTAKATPPPAAAPVVKKAPPVAAKATPAQSSAATASGSGAYVLQVGAYKSQAEANSAWATYQKKHPIVGGYSHDVQVADLGAKGTWYRLRIGSFNSKDAADSFCAKLKADGGGCFPAKR